MDLLEEIALLSLLLSCCVSVCVGKEALSVSFRGTDRDETDMEDRAD